MKRRQGPVEEETEVTNTVMYELHLIMRVYHFHVF